MRFFPLPPSFNARPMTMFQWAGVFGLPIYHGKELWRHRADEDAPRAGKPADAEAIITHRMVCGVC